ncbi:MAG TPA: MBL fold metallo-hydrolase, partial [Chthoniobacterales bacterium]
MKTIPLEDTAADILGKAQRGLGISDSQLAEAAGADRVRRLRDGDFDEAIIEAVAPVLGLHAPSLLRLARDEWTPENVSEIDGLAQFNTNYGDMTVNAYLAWDPASREAIAFDTGADCTPMLECVTRERLTVKLILLTHSHPD